MKEHCESNRVKNLSMPRIGCGLDNLQWTDVKKTIVRVFHDIDINITIYDFKPVSLCFILSLKIKIKN